MYKAKIPILLPFNKVDVVSHEGCIAWMRDFEALDDSLSKEKAYLSSLSRSLSLVLSSFYEHMNVSVTVASVAMQAVGVSAKEGLGFDELLKGIERGTQEYYE